MFEPWIGPNYESNGKIPKTLILGESHYGDHHTRYGYELRKKTIHNIEEQVTQDVSYRYYTKLVSSFIGHRPTLSERKEFWHGVAYHNLITTPLAASRCAPTAVQWQESLPTLTGVVDFLKPEYVVVLGYRMWWRVAALQDMRNLPEIKDSGPCGVRAFGASYFHGIMHPSGAYSPPRWYAAMNTVKTQLWSIQA